MDKSIFKRGRAEYPKTVLYHLSPANLAGEMQQECFDMWMKQYFGLLCCFVANHMICVN